MNIIVNWRTKTFVQQLISAHIDDCVLFVFQNFNEANYEHDKLKKDKEKLEKDHAELKAQLEKHKNCGIKLT